MKLRLVVCMVLLSGVTATAQTSLKGLISTSQTWTAAGNPYTLDGNVTIDKGVTIQIKPGVKLVNASNYKIIVNGTIEAVGVKDTTIDISDIGIETTAFADDFKPGTGKGLQFVYCRFFTTKTNSVTYQLSLFKSDVKVDHCDFNGVYYAMYGSGGDSLSLWVSNSSFTGNKYGYGYVTYGLFKNSYLSFTDNKVMNMGYLYTAEKSVIKNNYFSGNNVYPIINVYYYTKNILVSCNFFKKGSVGISVPYVITPGKIRIEKNEFDSIPVFLQLTCTSSFDSIDIVNNNFHRYSKYAIDINGCNSTTGKFKALPIGSNYWYTTDTALINNMFHDFRSEVMIPWKITYSTYLSSPVSTCWPTSGTGGGITGSVSGRPVNQGIQVRPNPFREQLTMEGLTPGAQIKVIDLQGVVVTEIVADNDQVILNTGNWLSGVFYVYITEKNGTTRVEKVIRL